MRRGTIAVEFEVRRERPGSGPLIFEADLVGAVLVVRGRLRTGDLGRTLTVSARRHRRQLILVVIADGGGASGLDEFSYVVRVPGLPAGRHTLSVRHLFRSRPGVGGAAEFEVYGGAFEIVAAAAAEGGTV